jgi:menaquinone-specific isochorismate synthase
MSLSTMISDLEQQITTKKREYGHAVLSFSFLWKPISLLDLLQRVKNQARVYWDDPQTGMKIAGFGIAEQLWADGPSRFIDIENETDRLFERLIVAGSDLPEYVQPRMLGGFSFRPYPKDVHTTPWDGFPPSYFLLPRLVLTQKDDSTWVTVNRRLDEDAFPYSLKRYQDEITTELETLMGAPSTALLTKADPSLTHPSISIDTTDMPEKSIWLRAVAQTSAQISNGDFQKAVLSRARIYHLPAKVSPAKIVRRLENRYPNCYKFWIEPQPGRAFCGATPELLAEVHQGTFVTMALAGSIARGVDAYSDQKLGRQLLASAKNNYEHRLVVENIRSRLHGLVDDLKGPKRPQLRKLTNIQHLETPLHGRLKSDTSLLALVDCLHPTPAMGGVPGGAALQHIDALESHDRGWYAAPVGWLGPGGVGTFAVGIRSAVVQAEEVTAFAGAGIMATSNPEKEWLETEMKFNPLLDAVEFACHENNPQS